MILIYALIAIIAVALDVISKCEVIEKLIPVGSMKFIPGFIDFQYVENTGAAFGMMKDSRWIFIIVSAVAIVGIGVYVTLNRNKIHPLLGVGLSMVVGGGIGNQIDRIVLGYVVDFIHFDFYFPVLEEFPTFNVADSFVTVGAVIIVIAVLFFDKTSSKDKKTIKTDGGEKNDI